MSLFTKDQIYSVSRDYFGQYAKADYKLTRLMLKHQHKPVRNVVVITCQVALIVDSINGIHTKLLQGIKNGPEVFNLNNDNKLFYALYE